MLNSVLDSMHDNESRKPEASSSFGAQRASSTPSSSSAEPLPTVGPDYYELRRQQWLRPTTSSSSAAAVNDDVQSTSSSSSSGPVGKKNRQEKEKDSSKARLEELLSAPGAEEDEELWKTYLHTVHDGLVGGKKFKRGIKLSMAVKILKAGWLRDGTWDVAAAASMNSIPTTTTTTIIAAAGRLGNRASFTFVERHKPELPDLDCERMAADPNFGWFDKIELLRIDDIEIFARGVGDQVRPVVCCGSGRQTEWQADKE
ncbi:hypothetical protein FRB90_004692 [Tulasnella sp. 427]|nr:hypothetical protein FRB90_004692 [Tulasnella sp. 427]